MICAVIAIMISSSLIAADAKAPTLPTETEQLVYARAEAHFLRVAAELHRLRAELLAMQDRFRSNQEKLNLIRRNAEDRAGCPLDEALAKCAAQVDAAAIVPRRESK